MLGLNLETRVFFTLSPKDEIRGSPWDFYPRSQQSQEFDPYGFFSQFIDLSSRP